MSFLVLEAYLRLIQFDVYLCRGNFHALYEKVRRYRVRSVYPAPSAKTRICEAVDVACIWYWKEALCLQRSAAATCLLRKYGVPAEMLIGVQDLPFKSHAWVELDGLVVNDKPYMREIYSVLDHC